MIAEQKRVDLLLLITAHALILCGLVCVILTGEIPIPLWLLALAAHPLSTVMKPKEGRYFFNSIVILAFCYFLFLYVILQFPFLVAFTQFLIVVQAVKLFHLEKAKDYFQLAGLGLLTVLAAAGLTSQFYYLFMLLIMLLFGIWFLFLLHLKRDMEQHVSLPHPPRQLTSPSLLLGISGVAFCSFILTILIFFTLPRITLSVSGREGWEGASSGFSEIVDLGNTGPVRLDNRVVMRVELPQFSQNPPFPLYWRGVSFARWNGQTWERENILTQFSREKGGGVVLHRKRDQIDAVYQIIMIEPLGTDILFSLHPALEVRGNFSYLYVDEGGGLHLPSAPHGRYSYEVRSAPNPWEDGDGGSAEIPDERYLLLPEVKKEVTSLAQEIVVGATSPQEKVLRVIAYLQNNCTYSLDPKRDERFGPVEDFLLHSREGYCEHFATAAALLLRVTGIHTRLVCGFLQGEWNSLGRYFMVRQRDAHTWIEAYLPGYGWTTFDPTPAGEAKTFPPFFSSVNRYYDFLKLKWNRYIIQYSRRDQLRFLLAFRRQIMGLYLFPHSPSVQGIRDKTSHLPSYLLAGLAAFACILLIFWGFKKKRRALVAGVNQGGKFPSDISFYLKMLKILDKKKITKKASETPAEFVKRVSSVGSTFFPWIERITSLYYKVRFGRIPLTPYEEEETGKIIRDLRKRFSSPSASVKS
jgi:hypothetical protein